jgi:hypothetical protein
VGVSVGNANAIDLRIDLVPNPNAGEFELRITLPVAQTLNLSLVNSLGQVVMRQAYEAGIEERIRFTDLALAEGVYYLQIKGDDFMATRKVVVVKR